MKDWEFQYSALNQRDRDDPMKCLIEDICSRDTLFNQRAYLYEMLSAAMGSLKFNEDDMKMKSDRMWHYETMLTLLEVAYRIRELAKSNRLRYSYE